MGGAQRGYPQFEARVICQNIGACGEHHIRRLLAVTLRVVCKNARKTAEIRDSSNQTFALCGALNDDLRADLGKGWGLGTHTCTSSATATALAPQSSFKARQRPDMYAGGKIFARFRDRRLPRCGNCVPYTVAIQSRVEERGGRG